MDKILLLPQPKKITYSSEKISNLNELPLSKKIDSSKVIERGDEAYRLEISKKSVAIFARTQIGIRWAEATLEQLKKYKSVPAMEIDDAPLFPNRGIMLDISRDRIPTMETLFHLVDLISSWKMNHLQLYVEHAIAYKGHEDINKWLDPITLEELSAVDKYCKACGVTLNANQNCLGHFERWLKHPKYSELGEVNGIYEISDYWFMPPSTLTPCDPKVLTLIEDILCQQIPLCSGPYANIGCDEPWDLGKGKSRELCEKIGKTKVFSKHLEEVCKIVSKLGKIPQFWCDPHPNEDQNLPEEIIPLVWGYDESTDFHSRIQGHLKYGRKPWTAPGTNCWNSCTGRTWRRRANLDLAASEKNSTGLLCTAWGDGGHSQQFPITLFGFADAAMAAWSGPGKYSDEAAGLHAFNSPELGRWLAELGNIDAEITKGKCKGWNCKPVNSRNSNALWNELNINIFEKTGNGTIEDWEQVAQRLDKLKKNLPENINKLLLEECSFSLNLTQWIVEKAILRRQNPDREQRKKLSAKMAEIINQYRKLWLARSRYGGLEDSSGRFMQKIYNP